MKIALSIVKWIAGILLGLIIVVGLCWWLIPDEELNPDARKFTDTAAVPPAAKNAYFMIWGFVASPELDPHVVGQQIVATHDRILAAEKDLSRFKVDAFYGEHKLTMPKDSKRFCDAEKENCLAVYQAKRAEMLTQAEEKKIYLARYRKIREYEDFSGAMSQTTFQTPIPAWNPILRMSDLVDGDIAERMKTKSTQKAALEELAAEVTSWRRLLQGNDWMITQMVSVATLGRKYRLASEIMDAYPEVVTAHPALMTKITAPLSPAATNVTSSMGAEARFTIGTFAGMGTNQRFLADSFFEGLPGLPLRAAFAAGGFRPNASTNHGYLIFKEAIDLFAKSPKQVLDGRAALVERQEKLSRITLGAIFYNPVGRITNAIGMPDFTQYAFRITDIIGFSRLLELKRRVIESNIALDKVPAVLANAGPELMDPYTEKPMQWDAATKRISFAIQGKRSPVFGYVTLEHFK